jgi:hypothetical protein
VGLVQYNVLKRYASGNVATGMVSQAGQMKSEVPDKDRHSGPPSLGLGFGLTSQSHKTKACRENSTIEFTTGRMLRIMNWAKI